MKKIAIFPYHPDCNILIEYRDALCGFELAGFLSYTEDTHLTYLLNSNIGLENPTYYDILCNCDAVIVLDNFRGYADNKYYQVIEDSIKQKKELLITPLAETQLKLEKYRGKYEILELLPAGVKDGDLYSRNVQITDFCEPEIPIIAVLGAGKHCGKFETQLLFKSVFEDDYKTAAIASNPLGALFGCYTVPQFMYGNIQFQDKIFMFNFYVNEISRESDFDVMLLGIPEGILQFEKEEFHHFAEYPLVITSAISVDVAVFCTYFSYGATSNVIRNEIEQIVESVSNRFRIPIDAVVLSGTTYELPKTLFDSVTFEFLEKSYVRKHYPDLAGINIPVFDILTKHKALDVAKSLLLRLQDNPETV